MPEYKCQRCGQCMSSKQVLQQHLNRKKPCASEETITKHRCDRCLKYFSSKQKLTNHKNKKIQCEKFRHTPVIMTELEKKMELEAAKEKIINEMKLEYKQEVLKIYKKINNIAICIKKKKILERKLNDNINLIRERKTIPENTPSIIPKKEKKEAETVENLVKYYKELQTRIKEAESKIDSMDNEQDNTILGINNILNKLSSDREDAFETKKQLRKLVDRHRFAKLME
jgi:hypothetical protein